jgi:hypothetical protein
MRRYGARGCFFKWIKQNLRIAYFMGTSENAVRKNPVGQHCLRRA